MASAARSRPQPAAGSSSPGACAGPCWERGAQLGWVRAAASPSRFAPCLTALHCLGQVPVCRRLFFHGGIRASPRSSQFRWPKTGGKNSKGRGAPKKRGSRSYFFPWEATCTPPAGTEEGTRPPKGNQAFRSTELSVSWACSLSRPRKLPASREAGRLSHGKWVAR